MPPNLVCVYLCKQFFAIQLLTLVEAEFAWIEVGCKEHISDVK